MLPDWSTFVWLGVTFAWLVTSIPDAVSQLWGLANGAFVAALVAGGLAAFYGARGAQLSAARDKRREDLLAEIRHTNAAVALCFIVLNTLLGLKSQHVKRMKETYDALRTAFVDHRSRINAGELLPPFELAADLETLETMALPVVRLEDLVFGKLNLGARPLIVFPAVERAVGSLNGTIADRTKLIEEFRALGVPSVAHFVHFYLGMPHSSGATDNRFPAAIAHLYKKTDDCIFFTRFLNDDLVAHGERTRARYFRLFGEYAPRIHSPQFDTPEAEGLFPQAEDYADWASMFLTRPTTRVFPYRLRVRRRLWDRPRTRLRQRIQRIRRWFVTPAAAPPAA